MPKKKPTPDPRWTSHLKPAPGDLRTLQAFLNTASPPAETDFASPRSLTDWLVLWELVPPGAVLGDDDLRRALEVRDALRALVALPDGEAPKREALRSLERPAASIRVQFGDEGHARFEPDADGLDAALARLCGLVVAAQLEGTWRRLKTCFSESCGAVFYDFSKNAAGKWCSSRCASRGSSLTYRRRNLKMVRDIDRRNAWYRRFNRARRNL